MNLYIIQANIYMLFKAKYFHSYLMLCRKQLL